MNRNIQAAPVNYEPWRSQWLSPRICKDCNGLAMSLSPRMHHLSSAIPGQSITKLEDLQCLQRLHQPALHPAGTGNCGTSQRMMTTQHVPISIGFVKVSNVSAIEACLWRPLNRHGRLQIARGDGPVKHLVHHVRGLDEALQSYPVHRSATPPDPFHLTHSFW